MTLRDVRQWYEEAFAGTDFAWECGRRARP